MIFTGKRQAGKTHNMVMEVLDRYKDGDRIAIVGYNIDHAKRIEFVLIRAYMNKYRISYNEAESFRKNIKIVKLNEISDFDHVLIDELDIVLGSKCVCSTGGVVNLVRKDEQYKGYEDTIGFDKYTFQEKENIIYKKEKDTEKFADELLNVVLSKLNEKGINLSKNNEENFLDEKRTIDKILKALLEIGISIELKDDIPDSEIPSVLLEIKQFVFDVMQCFKNEIEKCTKEIELTPKDDVCHMIEMYVKRSMYEHKHDVLNELNLQ
ncbi:MAG: hypothetical protein ACRC1T_09365 [Clostridium chrysemydis]|uniref:hypothetical protein n=1 Tax=Clostridium chrysemydis TaxID=2665504 RepID=UPI003F2FD48F